MGSQATLREDRYPRQHLSRRLAIGCVSRDDRRWTFPNDSTGMRLFHAAIASVRPFTAEELDALGHVQAS